MSAFFSGYMMSTSLIVAIGAQNAFVLRQGILRQHVLPVVAFCSLSDALLITFGVFGFGAAVEQFPQAIFTVRVLGVMFLLGYAVLSARRAYRGGNSLQVDTATPSALAPAIASIAALTFLNPHVYLDTVVLLGSVAQQHPPGARGMFWLGGVTGSAVWFTGLGYGARLLVPIFRKPVAWQILDGLICLMMVAIAVGLATSG